MDNIRQVVSEGAKEIKTSIDKPFLTPTQKGAIDLAEKKFEDLRDV